MDHSRGTMAHHTDSSRPSTNLGDPTQTSSNSLDIPIRRHRHPRHPALPPARIPPSQHLPAPNHMVPVHVEPNHGRRHVRRHLRLRRRVPRRSPLRLAPRKRESGGQLRDSPHFPQDRPQVAHGVAFYIPQLERAQAFGLGHGCDHDEQAGHCHWLDGHRIERGQCNWSDFFVKKGHDFSGHKCKQVYT